MRRGALLLALLTLAVLAGTARADVFQVVPTRSTALVPPPPAQPEQLDYPQLLALWQGAGAQYGVPWQVLAAINKVESDFGRNMGPSSAGAVGWMQFMPATWLEYGVDASGDGVADPWNAADAIYSAARYLAASGAATDLYGAVYAYNHADWYVQEVLDLARLYGGDTTIAFTLDRLQQQLQAARRTAARAGDRLQAARALVARLARSAANAPLLSTRLDIQKRQTLAEVRRDAAADGLVRARRALAKAQRAAKAASFNKTVGSLLGAPAASAGYVFPVGGGPGVVSVAHTHHDYPAADIAAPLGEPVYALANSVVQRSWSTPDPRCGIGLTLQAFDGQVWTYCHLAVLDPSVTPGAVLSAGQQVGLVGATGDATGPHLHLQLQPATAWPQEEPWFQSFAGSAFSWQDGPTPPPPPAQPVRGLASVHAGPVFRVVPAPSNGVVLFTRGTP
ncbi:MAG TPA: lytic murein transglycosylase [Gaiellaceae bacterium]|nr:lytic murein transglycosylase [Gaiellaceae bacterium]